MKLRETGWEKSLHCLQTVPEYRDSTLSHPISLLFLFVSLFLSLLGFLFIVGNVQGPGFVEVKGTGVLRDDLPWFLPLLSLPFLLICTMWAERLVFFFFFGWVKGSDLIPFCTGVS